MYANKSTWTRDWVAGIGNLNEKVIKLGDNLHLFRWSKKAIQAMLDLDILAAYISLPEEQKCVQVWIPTYYGIYINACFCFVDIFYYNLISVKPHTHTHKHTLPCQPLRQNSSETLFMQRMFLLLSYSHLVSGNLLLFLGMLCCWYLHRVLRVLFQFEEENDGENGMGSDGKGWQRYEAKNANEMKKKSKFNADITNRDTLGASHRVCGSRNSVALFQFLCLSARFVHKYTQ